MKPSVFLSFLVAILLHTSCHSSKNATRTTQTDTNTIATSEYRFQSARLDSALSEMAIQLDSFVINAEPIILNPCHVEDTTRSAVIAYRYHIKANGASVKGKRNAVSRSYGDTLQQNSIAIAHSLSLQCSEQSESNGVYKPPDGLALFLTIAIIIAAALIILWKSRK